MTEVRKPRKKTGTRAALATRQRSLLDQSVLRFGRAWIKVNEQTAEKGLAQTDAIELMKKLGLEKLSVEATGPDGNMSGTITVTLVEGSRLVIDYEKLKRKVGAKVWEKITKRVPDPALMDQAIKDGLLTPVDIAECSTTVANSPYLKPSKVSGNL